MQNSFFVGRLGPLSIEQKKRTVTKRARLEKNKEDERRPLELKEEELNQAENETTKNVRIVSNIYSICNVVSNML